MCIRDRSSPSTSRPAANVACWVWPEKSLSVFSGMADKADGEPPSVVLAASSGKSAALLPNDPSGSCRAFASSSGSPPKIEVNEARFLPMLAA
eukprot:1138552-Pyramimonas_sp.AAC.1